MTTTDNTGPLSDVFVVDLTRALAGPHATMMLGDLGATVVKVEAPAGGDDTRGWGPPFITPTGGVRESTYFLSANRNKRSIALDLKQQDDLNTLRQLLEKADVVAENFRPGVLDRMGLGFDELHRINPRLIILSISAFGHDGPESSRAGYDQIVQGEAGLMSLTGSSSADPQKFGTPITDLLAGMYGAYGILAALHDRTRTGKGSVVRTSLLAAAIGVHAFQGTRWTVAGEVGTAQGNHHPAIAPYGLFRCADGAVQIAVGSPSLWVTFCEAFGLDPDAEGFQTNELRASNRTKLIRLIEEVFANWGSAELIAKLHELGIPAGKLRSIDEVYQWEQTASQGLLIDVEHATLGTVTLPGPPLRFFDTTGAETTATHHAAPPTLNADGAAIRAWLGAS